MLGLYRPRDTCSQIMRMIHPLLLRAGATVSGLQSQVQGLRENMSKVCDERNLLKRDLEQKNQELEGKMSTINQVKKIGRRYKTQYEDLKAEHEKVKEHLRCTLVGTVINALASLHLNCVCILSMKPAVVS